MRQAKALLLIPSHSSAVGAPAPGFTGCLAGKAGEGAPQTPVTSLPISEADAGAQSSATRPSPSGSRRDLNSGLRTHLPSLSPRLWVPPTFSFFSNSFLLCLFLTKKNYLDSCL